MKNAESEATATEQLTKAATVTIGKKTYALRMTHGVYIEAETITGISTLTDAGKYVEKPSRKTLSAMFYALLRQSGADLTLDQVQALVSAGKNAGPVFEAVLAAHTLARAEEDAVPTVATLA